MARRIWVVDPAVALDDKAMKEAPEGAEIAQGVPLAFADRVEGDPVYPFLIVEDDPEPVVDPIADALAVAAARRGELRDKARGEGLTDGERDELLALLVERNG